MEQNKISKNLQDVYNDILDIKIDVNDSFKTSLNKFYEVMRKYGIKQGRKEGEHTTICNAEWNMCFSVFEQHKIISFNIWLCLNNPPEDLKYYTVK